jgi:tetratricopeptide (TPR) repeat protein
MSADSVELWFNMALAAQRLDRPDKADLGAKAVVHRPNSGPYVDLMRQCSTGHLRLAWAQRYCVIKPNDPIAHNHAAIAAAEIGADQACRHHLLAALVLAPDFGPGWTNAAATMPGGAAADHFYMAERATKIAPLDAGAWINLALRSGSNYRLNQRMAILARAIISDPASAAGWYNWGTLAAPAGRADAAVRFYARAAIVDSTVHHHVQNYLFNLHYIEGISRHVLADIHATYATNSNAGPQLAARPKRSATRGPVHVGFVSADFRQHSVAYFLPDVIEALSPSKVTTILYHNNLTADAVTDRYRAAASAFRVISGLSDQAVIDLIADDQIDVLVDLSGYTDGSRIGVFTKRAAPIQVSWLGYPGPLGLSAHDIRLTDDIADPMDEPPVAQDRPIRIAGGFLAYSNPYTPDSGPCPAERVGYVTFASFNNLAKLTKAHAARMAAILAQVPKSRLILKAQGFSDPDTLEYWLDFFGGHSIPPERLRFEAWRAGTKEHLELYRQVDIALDCFPYNGVTTTCDALWMGVPVVSLAGDRHSSRVSASLLSRVDLADLASNTPDGFIAAAVKLANDPIRRQTLRDELRNRIKRGPLGDAGRLARALEQIFEDHAYQSQASEAARSK